MPDKIQRTVDETTPLDLDANENLIELPQGTTIVKHDLMIPFSLKNLRMLCAYPLKGKENTPVFDKNSWEGVFNQCSAHPSKVTVYFMRKCVADQSRNKSYATQQLLVKSKGFEVTPLRERVLFDAVEILKFGTCPDIQSPVWAFTRTADVVRFNGNDYPSVIGGYTPRVSVCVDVNDYDSDFVGVAPGVPANNA